MAKVAACTSAEFLVKLRTGMAPIQLLASVDCLKFPKGSTEELPNLDLLYTYYISRKVV